MNDMMFSGIAGLVVLIIIFLICREVICWYWKINESVELLKDIKSELQVLNKAMQSFQL